jgi:tetratricopeptide (TPR) repeat protein
MWLQAPLDYHRLVELPEQRAIYAQLNMVTNVKGQTLGQYGAKIRERAAAINPSAVILDLRLNRGGNGNLRNTFIPELIRAEDEDTRLIVLTWRGTFSASQFILDDLDRLTNAVFIGEPASSKPTSYGDGYRIVLPNSGITARVSILYWQEGQSDDPWTWIDVAAPLRFADYQAGRDPALEAALNYRPKPPLAAQVAEAAKTGGMAAMRRTIDAYRSDPANRYANIERQMIVAVETLNGAGQREEALGLAKLATELYPRSVDAFTVLALVAQGAKQPQLALEAARKTIELDPNNRTVRPILETVR